jgi:hypothetical protein
MLTIDRFLMQVKGYDDMLTDKKQFGTSHPRWALVSSRDMVYFLSVANKDFQRSLSIPSFSPHLIGSKQAISLGLQQSQAIFWSKPNINRSKEMTPSCHCRSSIPLELSRPQGR